VYYGRAAVPQIPGVHQSLADARPHRRTEVLEKRAPSFKPVVERQGEGVLAPVDVRFVKFF
jgi:hypothetical protein